MVATSPGHAAVPTVQGHEECIKISNGEDGETPVIRPDQHVRESNGRLHRWIRSKDPESGQDTVVFIDSDDNCVSTIHVHEKDGHWFAKLVGNDGEEVAMDFSDVESSSVAKIGTGNLQDCNPSDLEGCSIIQTVSKDFSKIDFENDSKSNEEEVSKQLSSVNPNVVHKRQQPQGTLGKYSPNNSSLVSSSVNPYVVHKGQQPQGALGKYSPNTSSLLSSSVNPYVVHKRQQSRGALRKYSPDTYSLLSLHGAGYDKVFFVLFSIGIVVFLIQMSFLALMILSVFDENWSTNRQTDNPDADSSKIAQVIDANATPLVRATQILAIVTYVLFTDESLKDITTAVEVFPDLRTTSLSVEVGLAVLSCFLRAVQGATAVFAAFLLVVTSTSVIDIILNFTAVKFISSLDEIAFEILELGKHGEGLAKEVKRIKDKKLPDCQQNKNAHNRFQCTLVFFGLLMIGMLCTMIYFQESDRVWLTQVLRVDIPEDEDLRQFSGCYEMNKTGESYKRKVYTSFDNYQDASIGYCIETRRWVLFDEGANACQADETSIALAYSERTDSFDVSTSFDESWITGSGAPLNIFDNYFSEKGRCSDYGNGKCDQTLNNNAYQFDGGDCCAATCTRSKCGLGGITDAFGMKNLTGDGYPNCIDPTMVPITISLGDISSNTKDGQFLGLEFLDPSRDRETPDTAKNTLLKLQCNGKLVLEVAIDEEMTNQNETVQVEEGASCNLEFLSTRRDVPTLHATYKVFYGEEDVIHKAMLELNSEGTKKVEFFRIPSCMLKRLSEYSDTSKVYDDSSSVDTFKWLFNDVNKASDCGSDSFIERYALGILSFSQKNNTEWIDSTHQCRWTPIECIGRAVSSINLKKKNLTGKIPEHFKLFKDLLKLKMDENQLSGQIPSSIGSLTKLIELSFGKNMLTGTIPVELGLLKELQLLNLRDNQLSGQIPSSIGSLTKLTILTINENMLTGTIPVELGLFKELQVLFLFENQLSGQIPSFIGSLPKLRELSISTNLLNGTIPVEFGLLKELQALVLFENQLSGQIPSSIGSLTKLTQLSIGTNLLNGTIPVELGLLKELQLLNLFENQVSGQIPSSIGSLTKLTSLSIGENMLNGTIPVELGLLKELQALYLYLNQLSGQIPSSIGSLTKLTQLSIDENMLTGTIPVELGLLKELQVLFLYGNFLSSTIPSQIGSLSNLMYFLIEDNLLSGTIPTEIGLLTSLRYLMFQDNSLTGTVPYELGLLPNLRCLLLDGNNFTLPFPPGVQDILDRSECDRWWL